MRVGAPRDEAQWQAEHRRRGDVGGEQPAKQECTTTRASRAEVEPHAHVEFGEREEEGEEASEGENGSIDVAWIPSGSPDVVGYTVEYGSESVAGGAASYEFSLDAGSGASYSIEGLGDGTWYVAVRSKNFAGMLSSYSAEESVTLVPTAVFITAFSARGTATGVELAWEIWTDEELRGFHVYRALDGESAETLLNGGRLIDPAHTTWVDTDVEPATTYWYKFSVVGENGVEHSVSLTAGANVNALGVGDFEFLRGEWNRRGDRTVLPTGETYGGFCVPKEFSLLYAIVTRALNPETTNDLLDNFGIPRDEELRQRRAQADGVAGRLGRRGVSRRCSSRAPPRAHGGPSDALYPIPDRLEEPWTGPH